MVQLDVDSEVNHVVGPLNPKAIDHKEPVFIGGVPGKASAVLWCVSLKSQHVFQGKHSNLAFVSNKNQKHLV